MAHKIAHHAHAKFAHVRLNRRANIAQAITRARLLNALEQRLLGHLDQLARSRRERVQPADREAVCAVSHIPVIPSRDVDLDQVAALQLARPRNAVHYFVVDRHADVARVAKVAQRRRFGIRCLEHAGSYLVQLTRGHTRLRLLFKGTNRGRDDLAGLAHDGNLAR